ncbi:hypothetical protein [Tabrizicola sp.]|uniref:hypothetical protein n=1 Tax=Tabrizicola sp. TaxID=2005166 RepID=UPI003F67CB33
MAVEPPRLGDFPVVFLSYDEPWADRNWLDLKDKFSCVSRVHGVKGLDACHKAAAAAVPGDWVVTVDADTRVSEALTQVPVPQYLLTGDFRLDWSSLNPVNGLWTGNGSVKLWPKALIHEMRTHEAAPDGTLSLDHDIGSVRPGKSALITMPERLAVTNPAATAFHAFRAGLREMVYMRSLAEMAARKHLQSPSPWDADIGRLVESWCTIGRHAPNGRWMLYGSRLGVSIPDIWPDWDPRLVNDYDAVARLWSERIVPQFHRGPIRTGGEPSWNWQLLEEALRTLAAGIADKGGPLLIEFDAEKSHLLSAGNLLSSTRSANKIDGLGYQLLKSSTSADDDAVARGVLEQAAALDHPAAHRNLGVLNLRNADAWASVRPAIWHFRVGAALGNASAKDNLVDLAKDPAHSPDLSQVAEAVLAVDLPQVQTAAAKKMGSEIGGPLCLVLDRGVSLGPNAARHVPDPALVAECKVLGYMSTCAVTGLPRPRGVRVTTPQQLMTDPGAAPAAILPIVLGQLPPPSSAAEALREGYADAGHGIPLLLATLGRDANFGEHWIIGALLARTGEDMSPARLRRLAGQTGAALEKELAAASEALSQQTGTAIQVWSADESRALKRMLSPIPSRSLWHAAAQAFAGLGPISKARAEVLHETANSVWGYAPDET